MVWLTWDSHKGLGTSVVLIFPPSTFGLGRKIKNYPGQPSHCMSYLSQNFRLFKRIEFIRSKLSNCPAHVTGVSVSGLFSRRPAALCRLSHSTVDSSGLLSRSVPPVLTRITAVIGVKRRVNLPAIEGVVRAQTASRTHHTASRTQQTAHITRRAAHIRRTGHEKRREEEEGARKMFSYSPRFFLNANYHSVIYRQAREDLVECFGGAKWRWWVPMVFLVQTQTLQTNRLFPCNAINCARNDHRCRCALKPR